MPQMRSLTFLTKLFLATRVEWLLAGI